MDSGLEDDKRLRKIDKLIEMGVGRFIGLPQVKQLLSYLLALLSGNS